MRNLRKIGLFPLTFVFLLVGFTLFYKCSERGFDWVWIYRWVLVLSFLLAFFAYRIAETVSTLLGLTFFYLCFQGLLYASTLIQAPIVDLLGVSQEKGARLVQACRMSAGMSAFVVLLVAVFILSRSSRWLVPFFKGTLYLPLALGSVITALGTLFMKSIYEGVPILINPSLAGTFIAVMMLGESNGFVWAISLVALVMLKASTPLMALLVGGFVRFILLTRKRFWGAAVGLAVLAISLPHYVYPKLSDGNGRFPVWGMVWGWFTQLPLWAILFGTGLGSTPVLVPTLQIVRGVDPLGLEFFMYLHNDWLQLLFETGLVGLVLSVSLYGLALWKSRRDAKWCGMISAYGAAMFTNFPLHAPILGLVGMMLLGGAFLED